MQTRAIVEFGDLNLNRAMQVYGAVGDLALYDGRYYPSKAPLMSFTAVPVYFGLRTLLGETPRAVSELALVYFSRLFLTVLPTLLVLLWIRRFLVAYVSPPTADAITLTYALGTLAFSYSLLFMSHQPSAVLLFAAFYGLWRWSRGEWPDVGLLACGALASASVLAEYTTAIAVLGLGVYGVLALVKRAGTRVADLRASALFIGGAVPLALLLMWYHTRAFGGPLDSGYRHLADVAYQPWHEGGFLGVGLPQPRAFFLSFFSPLRGLFALSPGLLLAGPGLVLLFRRARSDAELRPVAWTTLAIALGYTYFTSAFSYESWGWTTGPRHLTPLVPFLLLPAALALEGARATLLRGPCAVLLGSSIFVTSALTFVNYIPDGVSNAVAALAVPLTRSGDLTPSVLCALGFANPAAGAILWLGVAAGVAWLFWSLRPRASLIAWAVTLCTAAVVCGFQVLTYDDSPADRAALALLQRVWLAPPGYTFGLLTPGPEGLRGRVR
jgi:4-amino-4-deoxy-L-arabinose transferase-like glycosyltransferase